MVLVMFGGLLVPSETGCSTYAKVVARSTTIDTLVIVDPDRNRRSVGVWSCSSFEKIGASFGVFSQFFEFDVSVSTPAELVYRRVAFDSSVSIS